MIHELDELKGKTIAEVENAADIVLLFTDGTYAVITSDDMGSGCGIEARDLTDQEQLQLGLIDLIELKAREQAVRDANDRSKKEVRRKAWEKLNQEFSPDSGPIH